MIVNKAGEAFVWEGEKYEVGDEILANEQSAYRGLLGEIVEIRTDADRKTENDAPEICCRFFEPVLPCDVQAIERRFSKLYGCKKRLDEIPLDRVIMAPQMIVLISKMKEEKKETVYAVLVDWAENDENGSFVVLTATLLEAQLVLRQILNEEARSGGIFDRRGEAEIVEESDDCSYEIFEEQAYCSSHFSIRIHSQKLCGSNGGFSSLSKVWEEDKERQIRASNGGNR